MVFNVVPTIFELALVSTVLVNISSRILPIICGSVFLIKFRMEFQGLKCGSSFAILSVSCVGVYAIFTLAVTQWRTKFRVFMNRAENEAGSKAVDSLINYENVKVGSKG